MENREETNSSLQDNRKIQNENRLLEQEKEELEGKIAAIKIRIEGYNEDEKDTHEILEKSRNRANSLNPDIYNSFFDSSQSLDAAIRHVDDIHHSAKIIDAEFLETCKSISALKEARKLRIESSKYRKEKIELQNAAIASFINPQLHIVKQSNIHSIVERISLYHADDWITHAVLALYSTQNKGSTPFSKLLTKSAKDALQESPELQQACSFNLNSTCLFMIIFIIKEIAFKRKNYNSNSDIMSSLVHAAGDWLMMLSDSIITFSENAMNKIVSTSLSTKGDENVLFTSADVWMAESLFSLYAVIARQLKTEHYSQTDNLHKHMDCLIDFWTEQEGFDRATASALLQQEYINQTLNKNDVSEEPDNINETPHTPVWEKKDLFTEFVLYCPEYDKLAEIMGRASGCRLIYEDYTSYDNITSEDTLNLLRDTLKQLVMLPTEKEAYIDNQVRFLELVSKYKGREDKARQAQLLELQQNGEFHIIRNLSKKAYDKPGLRRCLVELLLHEKKSAIFSYVTSYRSLYHENWTVKINTYQKEIDFGKRSEDVLEQAKNEYQSRELMIRKKHITIPSCVCVILAISCAVFFVWKNMYSIAWAASAILLAASALLIIYDCHRRERIIATIQNESNDTQYVLSSLFEEFDNIRALYLDYDHYGDLLIKLTANNC